MNTKRAPKVRFKGFTDAWEQRKLGELVDVCSGRDYKHLSEGDIISGNGLLNKDVKLKPYPMTKMGLFSIRKGTIES